MSDAAIVGDRGLIAPLGALGIGLYFATGAEEARDGIAKAAADGAKVIFIFEKLAKPIIEEIKDEIRTLVILIPDNTGSSGLAERVMRGYMAKAIGTEEIFR